MPAPGANVTFTASIAIPQLSPYDGCGLLLSVDLSRPAANNSSSLSYPRSLILSRVDKHFSPLPGLSPVRIFAGPSGSDNARSRTEIPRIRFGSTADTTLEERGSEAESE
ncbi:hypothetical protein FRC12_000707 [Ceratobasidium sp. 428]|nr:hypothetical protein FRC12_000707 [Ceratobasidium sp. 428]